MIEIYRRTLPMHPLLGRHVHFDSRSKAYALQPKSVTIKSVRHESYIPILDQGDVGSCTGNAGDSCLYHGPFYTQASKPWPRYSPDEDGALLAYEDFTAADPYDGVYPPDDTGSDGLTVCQVFKAAGDIAGYQPALDLAASLAGLMSAPGITGIPFYNSMFDVDSSGLMDVNIKSGLAGGHELCVDEIVTPDDQANGTGQMLVGGPNSWGTQWGAEGRWYMRALDWWTLRQNEGDVYFFTPLSEPAPTPAPDPDVDGTAGDALWLATKKWSGQHHTGDNAKAAKAVASWAGVTGRK